MDISAGDIFTLVWSPTLQTIFFGCQNTSLQWLDFPANPIGPPPHLSLGRQHSHLRTPPRTPHKFFDSYPQYQRKPADLDASNPFIAATQNAADADKCFSSNFASNMHLDMSIPLDHVIDSAHYGYIYCMAVTPSSREGTDDVALSSSGETLLVTGSGDESVKVMPELIDSRRIFLANLILQVWKCTGSTVAHLCTFECGRGAVLSIATRGDLIFAGCQDGYVMIWDLETRTLIRTLIVQEVKLSHS